MYYNTPISVNYHTRIAEDPLLSISKLYSKSALFFAVLYYPSNGVEFSQFLNSNFVSFQCHHQQKEKFSIYVKHKVNSSFGVYILGPLV